MAAHHAELVRICHVVARERTIAEEAVPATWSIAWRKLGMVRQPERLLIAVAVTETRKLLKGCHRLSTGNSSGQRPR